MSTAVWVTGASGFIGRTLCSRLAADPRWSVFAITRNPESFEIPGCKVVGTGDYGDLEVSSGSLCVHLAGENVPSAFDSDPAAATQAATQLTEKVRAYPFEFALYASSAVIYGDQYDRPVTEIDSPRTSHPYGLAKLRCEELFTAAGWTSLRFSNVFGLGMSNRNVLSAILQQARSPGPLLLEDLSPVRDFIHVSDAVEAIERLLVQRLSGVFNVGTGLATSIAELAHIVAPEPREIRAKRPSARASYLVLNSDKLKKATGWRAQVSLADGLLHLYQGIL